MLSNAIRIETKYSDYTIEQATISPHGDVYVHVIRLQDEGVRDALINLGWTPPGSERDTLIADRDRLAAELANMKRLLSIALPHVEASAGAEHLFDGFRPQRRPLDGVVEGIRSALAKLDERGEG